MADLPASVAERIQALTYSDRAAAYIQLDAAQTVIGAGGHLANYGLETLRLGEPATEQAIFLEGLLPVIESPYYVPSIELAGGRSADLHFHNDAETTWIVLLDVTAERDAARRVQQKAYDMTLLQEKEALLNRRLEAANAALLATQRELESSQQALMLAHQRLQDELAEAAIYVRSLLPAPLSEPFIADWRFVPSTELGGDAFGYHWIDPDHFAMYLLDVCGHGVGPSLLSVAILHVLQTGALGNVDFRDPGQVLRVLNETYQMQRPSDLYFTLWYGVYQPASRCLDFGCAGHPAALLIEPGAKHVDLLKAKGAPIGLIPGTTYVKQTVTVPRERCLYLLSDGAFEVERPDGTMLSFEDFTGLMAQMTAEGDSELDRLYQHLVTLRGGKTLEDDFSIMRFVL